MPQVEQTNGFDQCCIIQFSSGYWRAKKKLSKERLTQLVQNNPKAAEWLTGNKSIINPAEIKKIGKVNNKAVTYLNPDTPGSPVLKHPVKGLKIIPFTLVEKCNERLEIIKAEMMEARDYLLANLDEFKDIARGFNDLDGLYNELDFPQDIKSKFYFEWRFLSMSSVPEEMAILSPDVYQKAVEKMSETLEEIKADSISALRVTFHDMIAKITERFTSNGETKTFRNSTVNNFYDFFQQFKERNIFNDEELSKLVIKAQAVLKNRDPDEIRDNDSMKKLIRKDMLPLEKELENLTKTHRRKLDLN